MQSDDNARYNLINKKVLSRRRKVENDGAKHLQATRFRSEDQKLPTLDTL